MQFYVQYVYRKLYFNKFITFNLHLIDYLVRDNEIYQINLVVWFFKTS